MLNILFPFVGDSVGGSHHSIIELYYELKKTSIKPFILIHKKGPLSTLLDSMHIEYYYLPIRKMSGESPSLFWIIYGIFSNYSLIRNFLKKNKVDIVHGNDLRVNLTWSLSTKISGVSYVWHQRTKMSNSPLWNASNYLADYFVTISQYVHQSLPSNIPKSKKKLILNPFNIKNIYDRELSRKWINELYNIPKVPILIGYVGRLVYWKNVDFLIECFAKYAKINNCQLHLVIVGTGNSKYIDSLKQLVCKLGINNIVTYTGFNPEPNRIISAIDLMIAPSDREPFGRTLVEAMIQKTPVLAARGGGHSEIIENGVTGRLYNHNKIDDFTSQLDMYINDNNSTCEITNKANITANIKYDSYQHAKSVIQIYQQLVED